MERTAQRVRGALPPRDSQEFRDITNRFLMGGNEEVRLLARELGYRRSPELYRGMRRRGVFREYKVDVAPPPEIVTELSELEGQVLTIVRGKPSSVGEISRRIDRSSETVIKVLDSLRQKHHMVELDNISRLVSMPPEPQRVFAPTEFKYFHKFYRIGGVSDTHLGSKYQQLTALHDAYKIFDERDVDCIFHAGDLVDGMGMYRGQIQETFLHDAREQREYAETVYPKPRKEGVKTYLIGGQHDRSFYGREGYDILEHIAEHRQDIVYRGFYSHEFQFKGLPVKLEHPGGGVAYARSYSPQKIVENMMGYINTIPSAVKPALMVTGHWHTPLHLPVYMGVDTVCLPCFQAQTPYMQQKKNMMPTIGCVVMEVWLNEEDNLSSVKVEFIIMNDRIREKDW